MRLFNTAVIVLFASASPLAPASAVEELSADELVVQSEFFIGSEVIGFGFGSLWAVSGKRLVRIQAADNKAVEIELKMPHIDSFRGFAFGEGAVWLADISESELLKIDPEANQVVKRIPAPMLSGQGSVGVGEGSIWVVTAQNRESTLTRINAASGNVEAKIPLPSAGSGVAFDFGAVWVTGPSAGELYRIDPSTNHVTTFAKLHGLPGSIATGDESIWVVSDRDRVVDRIDPKTGQLMASIATGIVGPTYGSAIGGGGGYIWVESYPAAFMQIDPKTNTMLRKFTGGHGWGFAYGADSLWKAGPTLQRIAPPGP